MGGTVYLLGAGVNRALSDFDGLSPPMSKDFFQVVLKSKKFSSEGYQRRVQEVFDYLKRQWKRTTETLAESPFDLEDCFSILDAQLEQAILQKDEEKIKKLLPVQLKLKSLLGELLGDFEHFAAASPLMRSFGRVLLFEKPTILTFNYDC